MKPGTAEELKAAAAKSGSPPPGLSGALAALWHDARGDWERAHECAQEDRGADGAWVHAYLHRKEGDLGNAGYWYARAGRPAPRDLPLDDEWSTLARELLARS
ncbi:MAG TPA: hypothetical protein VHV47_01685 [Opitutaceae bacterium]|jgi:hypothetical protein|nr:hypothetical protein [Opitutaceae bacterium]